MGKLSFKLLGSPEVYHAGQSLHFATRKSLALLVYLTVEKGAHSRDKLTALFWPDSPPKQARAALRNTLLRLRATLREETHLIVVGNTLALDTGSGVDIDLERLDAILLAAHNGDLAQVEWTKVAALCNGDFLEGFLLPDSAEFEDWVVVQREYWYQKVAQVLDSVCHVLADTGQSAAAVETARRWVALQPFNEDAHRRVIETYRMSGNREAALRAFAACQNILETHLGTQPDAETQALVKKIQAVPVQRSSARYPPGISLPWVGRAGVFSQMVQAFYQCQKGAPAVIVLEGEPGIGKSRLATEFLTWADHQGGQVLSGRAFEAGGRLPYQPLLEALQAQAARISGTDLASSFLEDQNLDERSPPMESPARLFATFAKAAERLSGGAPLVWCIDNLQWLDSDSLDLLQFLAHRWSLPNAQLPAVLLFTVRSEYLQRGQPGTQRINLDTWLADLSGKVKTLRLSIGPLMEQDVVSLVTSMADEPGSGLTNARSFGRWLYNESEGQPLFILEILKTLAQRGLPGLERQADGALHLNFAQNLQPGIEPATAIGLPSGIRDLIHGRLAHLSPAAWSLLTAGAILGKRFSFDALVSISGLDEEKGFSALDELLASGLFVEASLDEGLLQAMYLFSHDKLREVAILETNAARRKYLHRRAFEALRRSGAHPAELSHHALSAGLHWEGFELSVAAGDRALRLYALHEAVQHFRTALQLWETKKETSAAWQELLPELYIKLGRAHELLNELDRANTIYHQMSAYAEAAGRPDLQVLAMNRQATLLTWQSFDLPATLQLLRQAQQLAESSGDRAGLAETIWNLAQIAVYSADPGAEQFARQAIALARELDRPDLLARSLNTLAHCQTGHWEEVEETAEQAYGLAEILGNRVLQAEDFVLLSQALTNQGRFTEGLAFARQGLAIAQEIENEWGQVFASFGVAMALIDSGLLEEALAVSQHGLDLSGQFTLPVLRVLSTTAAVLSNLVLFRDAEALALLPRAEGLDTILGSNHPSWVLLNYLRCATLAQAGDWQAAAVPARASATAGSRLELGVGLPYWLVVEALMRCGETDLARSYLEQLEKLPGHYPRQRSSLLMARGVFQGWEGDLAAAQASLAGALSLVEQNGSLWERWTALYVLGANLQKMARMHEAEQAFQQATEIVHALAAQIQDIPLREAYLTRALDFIKSSNHPA